MESWRRGYGKFLFMPVVVLDSNSTRAYTVANYWPRQSVTVPAIKGMYQKMLQSEMSGKQSSSAQPTNGQKNGV
jgi:hypothetical protein